MGNCNHAKRNASLPFSEIVDQLFITLFHKTGAVTFVIESSWNKSNQLSRLMLIGMLWGRALRGLKGGGGGRGTHYWCVNSNFRFDLKVSFLLPIPDTTKWNHYSQVSTPNSLTKRPSSRRIAPDWNGVAKCPQITSLKVPEKVHPAQGFILGELHDFLQTS